jgi:RNase P/RNase MRP subunit POP5
MLSLVDENMDAGDKLKNVKLIAALQQAQVQNERLKLEAHKVSGTVKTAMDLLR